MPARSIRRLHREQGRERGQDPVPSSATADRRRGRGSHRRHATPPPARSHGPARVKSQERPPQPHDTAQKDKKNPTFSPLRVLRPHPPDRLDLNRAHATMRGREGAFSQTKAARRRAAVSVDLTPERTEPRVSTSPRPPTCVRIVAGAVPTPTVPWQNPVWWSAWLPPRVRMQTVVSLIQQWLCLTRKDLRK